MHTDSSTDNSGGGGAGSGGSHGSTLLPWGARKERAQFPATIHVDTDLRPGEFVMRTLFAEFTVMAERKIETVMQEPLVSLWMKIEEKNKKLENFLFGECFVVDSKLIVLFHLDLMVVLFW